MQQCPDCAGGAVFGPGNGKCRECYGSGKVGTIADDVAGGKRPCPLCHGTGRCQTCGSKGLVPDSPPPPERPHARAELNPFDDKVAVRLRCPKCGDVDWFEWKFLGRLTDPVCGHNWYAGSGLYTAMQIRAIFQTSARFAKEGTKGASGEGECIGKIIGWFVHLVFGFCIRLEAAVIMIPIQAIAGLFQAKKTTSDIVTRLVVLVVTLSGIGVGLYEIPKALPPAMSGNSAGYNSPPHGGSFTPKEGIAAPQTQAQVSITPPGAPTVGNGTDANVPVVPASPNAFPNVNESASSLPDPALVQNPNNVSAAQVVDPHTAAREAYDYAMQLSLKGAVDDELPYINRAIQLDPQFAEAYQERGAIEGFKGHIEAAIQELNRAIELNPKLVRAYSNRGNCYWNLKNIDKAIGDYSVSLALDSTQPEVFATRGMAYSRIGNWAQAETDLREAIRLGSRNPSAYQNLGYTLFSQQRYSEAIQYFDQALALQPDLALALRYRGLAKQAIGRVAEGVEDLQRANALTSHP